MRKMQPGEMWLSQYWQFEDEDVLPPSISSVTDDRDNTSMILLASPPLLLHNDDAWDTTYARLWPRYQLSRRAYQCPTNTTSCTNINKPNSCCGNGETCMLLNNGETNDVGCCPAGATCGGSVGSCNTAAGYTYCSNEDGGCCIPGYQCDSIGCIASGTTTVTTSGTPIVVIQGSTSTTTTTPLILGTTTVLTSTTTITPSPSVSTVYSTKTTPTSTTTINLSVSTATSITVLTLTASPAVLATSMSPNQASSLFTTTITSELSPASTCPIGYYQCSAYVQCCQIGYGCTTSSCLQTASSTTITADSVVTIIVATGAGVSTVTGGVTSNSATAGGGATVTTTTATGSSRSTSTTTVSTSFLGSGTCASGWYGCAASNGGGCCPLGYSCAASCIATQTGEPGRVYKVPTSQAANRTGRKSHLTYALALVIAVSVMTW